MFLHVGTTGDDDATRRVRPDIVGPTKTWRDFITTDYNNAMAAANGRADVIVHCPHGYRKDQFEGAFPLSAYLKAAAEYPALVTDWDYWAGLLPSFYIGSPLYNDAKLGDALEAYLRVRPSTIALDHATTWLSDQPQLKQAVLQAFRRRRIRLYVEGGGDIESWPSWVGWMLESRSPALADAMTYHPDRLTVLCLTGPTEDRIEAAREAIGRGCRVGFTWNDSAAFKAAGVIL